MKKVAWNKGMTWPESVKKKISESKKGRAVWNKGIPRTDEERKKISQSLKGRKVWNKGRKWSKRVKRKIQITRLTKDRGVGHGGVEAVKKIKKEFKRIFIVHGHDHVAVNELEIFLKDHSLEAIVLHRKPDEGRTLIEKIEHYSNVDYAIIILTPDDTVIGSGPSVNKIRQEEGRARQNVIFEWGFFVGKFGRGNVCCLYKDGTALPSDVSGVVYKPFTNSVNEVKYELLQELKASKLNIS